MKLITKTLIATSLTVAMALAAQQQTPSSSDKSSSDKSSSISSSEKSKGGTESQTESTAGSQSSQEITSLQQLSTAASDPTSLQGKRVNLKDAKVGQVIGQEHDGLDAGRAAVLTTRHRHACVVVGRAGARQLLEDHAPPSEYELGLTRQVEFDGWEAHTRLLLGKYLEYRVTEKG